MARILAFGRLASVLGAVYVCGTLLGLALLVGAFRIGLLSRIDILFYRGLIVIALVAIATFVILSIVLHRWVPMLGGRDAFAATVLSLSLNLCFLVVVPVTVDRSISIFLLGEMAERGDRVTAAEASSLFKSIYVDQYHQIDRRLREQVVSGNVAKEGDAYRITRRGTLVVEVAKCIAWLFDSRAGLVAPRPQHLSPQRNTLAVR